MKKYNLGDLEIIFEKLSEAYNNYNSYNVANLKQNIWTADGKNINISIPINTVPHLLGIDTNYYKSVFSTKENSSSAIFEEMLERGAYNLYTNLDKIDIDTLISPFIYNKLENFINVTRIMADKIQFVCHYNKEKTYGYSVDDEEFDHLIVSKLNNGKYSFITISDNEFNNKLSSIPRSNQLIESEEELHEKLSQILINQNISIPTYVCSYDTRLCEYKFRYYFNEQQKINKILEVKPYVKKFDVTLDVSYDYEKSLGFSKKKSSMHETSNKYLELIINAMQNKKIITKELLNIKSFDELSDYLVSIIETYNNRVAIELGNDENSEISFSDMTRKIDSLQDEITLLEKEKENLLKQLEELNEKFVDSEIKKDDYYNRLVKINGLTNF